MAELYFEFWIRYLEKTTALQRSYLKDGNDLCAFMINGL